MILRCGEDKVRPGAATFKAVRFEFGVQGVCRQVPIEFRVFFFWGVLV